MYTTFRYLKHLNFFLQVLQVVIPGVNMPFSTSGFLFISIIISAFFHEIGHGIAAIKLVFLMQLKVFVFI